MVGLDFEPAAAMGSGVTLGEAAPNPFHPGTAISYELEQESVVTLKIYNHRGQMVACVADELLVGPGTPHARPGMGARRRASRWRAACTSSA